MRAGAAAARGAAARGGYAGGGQVPPGEAHVRRTGTSCALLSLLLSRFIDSDLAPTLTLRSNALPPQRCGVVKLHRSRFGEYGVEGLAPGEFRILPMPPWAAAAAEAGVPAAEGEAALTADT